MNILLTKQMGLTQVAIFESSVDFEGQLARLPFQPDIIFLDIHMKPASGFDLLKVLRGMSDYARKPIVALTASVMNEEIDQLKDAGFNGVIPKPIHQNTFPESFQKLLNGETVWQISRK